MVRIVNKRHNHNYCFKKYIPESNTVSINLAKAFNCFSVKVENTTSIVSRKSFLFINLLWLKFPAPVVLQLT